MLDLAAPTNSSLHFRILFELVRGVIAGDDDVTGAYADGPTFDLSYE